MNLSIRIPSPASRGSHPAFKLLSSRSHAPHPFSICPPPPPLPLPLLHLLTATYFFSCLPVLPVLPFSPSHCLLPLLSSSLLLSESLVHMLMSLSSPTLAGLTLLLAYEYYQSSMPLETALAVIPLALLAFAGATPLTPPFSRKR
jgi:hypothetical protein